MNLVGNIEVILSEPSEFKNQIIHRYLIDFYIKIPRRILREPRDAKANIRRH